ncbi:MAG: hypothetical protein AAFW95_05330 [Cyanobacteria bacterium J06638_6]
MTQVNSASPQPQNNIGKWVALGCGGCLGITVLAGIALTILLSRMVRFAVGPDHSPADRQELFVYNLPGESQNIFAMDLLGLEMTQVASTDSPPSVLLTMGKLPRYLQDQAARDRFISQFQERVTVEGSYQLGEQWVEDRTLCGQPVSVLLQSGRFEQGTNAYDAASLVAFVDYDDTVRFVWLLTHGDTPAATADQVFNSLDCR